ncbi:MAG TPA: FAD-binding oxidoreductase [Mycobacteriales bacterium]|nr:FAD-binding oxidoreductase [Mycobacteriales bacterium]
MSTRPDYQVAVAELRAQLAALPPGAPVRLGKRTSNLFRQRAEVSARLDVSAFGGVVEVGDGFADVLGMTTYEDLVAATLPTGQMPLVVPQLKTITLGGAVTGVGIESSSFRNGTPHESVLEMDVLTGDGRVVTCSRSTNADLFYGFPNSYGTLGYALRLRIELERTHPYVHLRHVRCRSVAEAAQVMRRHSTDGTADFVDGTWFSPTEAYVTLGSWADSAPLLSDYTGQQVYYRSVQRRTEDWLTVHDYLWRWDTDWFWCSRAFGVQDPRIRRLVPRRYLRSDTYWKLVAFERRHGWKAAWDRRRGRPDQEYVIQDVEVPVDALTEFMDVFASEVPIEPVWFCPLKQRSADDVWELYRLDPDTLYVNVGFWSSVPVKADPAHHNRLVEDLVDRLGGRKSLYSTAFYDRERFWELYNGPAYDVLKKSYDPDSRLLDLFAKVVERR